MTKENPVKKIPLKKIFGAFDKTNPDDMIKLTTLIQEKAAKDPAIKGYSVWNVDDDGTYAYIAPMNYSQDDNAGSKFISLDVNQGADIGAQKKTVALLESQNPGFYVTEFMRPEPTKCMVRLEQLDEKTLSTRRIFAAALSVKPWQIRVTRTPENGWRIRIKKDATIYQASKYDNKMQEAVETVGKEGWFFKADPESGVVIVYPGNPPTFKPSISMPKSIWSKPDVRRSYFGMKLPDKGRETGEPLSNDWKNASFVLVCGEAGGGKSVVIDSLIYGRLIAGAELYIGDEQGKSTDYNWCRPYVAFNGWGCDGLESTAAMLLQVLLKVDERAKVWHEHGWVNWWDIPPEMKKKYPPILLVMDEISQLDVPARLPAGLDKDNPDVLRKKYENAVKFSIQESMLQIVQKARYVGVTGIYASQSATQEAGIPPIMRTNLQSKIIVGEKVPDATRKSVLKDPKHAPVVPLNVIKEGMGKGTGVAELVGQEACVYKGYFEANKNQDWVDILAERVRQINPPQGDMNSGRLTWDVIVNLFPTAAGKPDDGLTSDDDPLDEASDRLHDEGGFGIDGRDVAEHDAPLKGAARAAHMSAIESAKLEARNAAAKGM
ncbi:cell division protein FtsK [Bifidobacterium callitrichidarum]|uniref:Cell division protein FtsK n=1 Tax=Bifidobacterium callitrichidarum TaxID=2052941 RepID=A0A2U2N949_9BIFI|nr:cell division protein FtsK [Bifidobacterium callitrichidarum]PWG65686.1 cell division protein FtsK [Bifidobacterium callitrichidarum]